MRLILAWPHSRRVCQPGTSPALWLSIGACRPRIIGCRVEIVCIREGHLSEGGCVCQGMGCTRGHHVPEYGVGKGMENVKLVSRMSHELCCCFSWELEVECWYSVGVYDVRCNSNSCINRISTTHLDIWIDGWMD